MVKLLQANSMTMQAFAEVGVPLDQATPLQNLERLALEAIGLQPDTYVNWRAVAELRAGSAPQPDIWLHLTAETVVPLTCQRCMGGVQVPLKVDQWYRFVASEEIAMAQDDACVEDLLVLAPQFDLSAVLEDELLMALPLVPMHDECPVLPGFSAGAGGVLDAFDDLPEKPHPFAALAQLKKM